MQFVEVLCKQLLKISAVVCTWSLGHMDHIWLLVGRRLETTIKILASVYDSKISTTIFNNTYVSTHA